MTRKQRIILIVVVLWSVVLGVPGVWLWRVDRQERLNKQLIEAIKQDDTRTALLALEQGADANARDEPRLSAWKRLSDLVRGRRAAKSTATTALSLSIIREDPQLTNALLAHGAHINEVDQYNCSPLCYAITARKKRIARLLIEEGANVNDVGAGWNLLALEIYTCRDTALTELMLEHGADIERVGRRGTWPPLVSAVIASDPGMVRLLLRHKADPNIEMMGTHPLEYAKGRHRTEIANLLREAGAKK